VNGVDALTRQVTKKQSKNGYQCHVDQFRLNEFGLKCDRIAVEFQLVFAFSTFEMKVFEVFVISSVLGAACSAMLGGEVEKFENLSRAAFEASLRVNRNGAMTLNVISTENSVGFRSNDFVKELMVKLMKPENAASRHETAKGIKKILNRKKMFVAFVVEGFKDFLDIYGKIRSEFFKFDGFYMIVLVNGEIPEVQKMFKLLWQLQIYNVNVMFENGNGEVLVKTFMPFSPRKCGDTTPVLINKFKDGKFQMTGDFSPKKFKNLHNCPIRAAVVDYNEPYVTKKTLLNGLSSFSGRDVEVLQALSESLNFKVVYSYVGNEGYYYTNGTSSGPLKTILDNRTDLSISNWWLKESRAGIFGFSNSYASDKLVFIIPPGKKFTALEKLIYPFKLTSWTLILLVFVIGTLVICVVKNQAQTTRDFVFGTGIKSPLLNLFVVFIGDSQNKLPRGNFARFLLMMFLIYSLVIRTVYQGSFFQLLKSKRGHQEVQSIQKMIDKNFKFYIYEGDEDLYQSTAGIKQRLVLLSLEKLNQIHERVHRDPDFAATYEESLLRSLYWNQQNDFDHQKRICKEFFMIRPEVIYTKKNFYLLEEINGKLSFLVNSGLIEFWSYRDINKMKLDAREAKAPKILTLSHFQGCFGILALGIVVSYVVFLCEVYY
jgi:hypothetical protein